MTIDELNKQTEYNATEYVNDSAPDIDAEHLNKNEQKLKETVQQANNIIDTLKALISDVQTESSYTVPSSSLVYQMQQQIDSISQGGVSGDYIKKSDISNVQVDDQNKVPSSALAYSMQQQINEANSNLEELGNMVSTQNYSLYSGTSEIAFSGGTGTLTHNLGLTTDYNFFASVVNRTAFLIASSKEQNAVKLMGRETSGSAIANLSTKVSIDWLIISPK